MADSSSGDQGGVSGVSSADGASTADRADAARAAMDAGRTGAEKAAESMVSGAVSALGNVCSIDTRALAAQVQVALAEMGIAAALAHCRRQSTTPAQFLRQFHQWFDAFRTLKFIHALRDAGWPQQSLAQLDTLQPLLWPRASETPHTVERLRAARAWRVL